MVQLAIASIFIFSLAAPALADSHKELAAALGYADSASWDCKVPALNDKARLQALQGYADTGHYATREGVLDAYMGDFKEGKSHHAAALALGLASTDELCTYAQNEILRTMGESDE